MPDVLGVVRTALDGPSLARLCTTCAGAWAPLAIVAQAHLLVRRTDCFEASRACRDARLWAALRETRLESLVPAEAACYGAAAFAPHPEAACLEAARACLAAWANGLGASAATARLGGPSRLEALRFGVPESFWGSVDWPEGGGGLLHTPWVRTEVPGTTVALVGDGCVAAAATLELVVAAVPRGSGDAEVGR